MELRRTRDLRLLTGSVAAYFLLAVLGWLLTFRHDLSVLVWPAWGIAMAAMALQGPRTAPWFLLAEFAAQWLVHSGQGTPPSLASLGSMATIAGGSVAAAALGAWLLIRFAGVAGCLDEGGTPLVFLAVSAVTTALAAAVTTALLGNVHLLGAAALMLNWMTGWAAFLTSAIVLAPLVFAWTRPSPAKELEGRSRETCALLLVSITTGTVVFGGWPFDTRATPLGVAALIPILWGALRFGRTSSTLASLLIALAAMAGTLNGRGPFALQPVEVSLLLALNFIPTAALVGLIAPCLPRRGKPAVFDATSAHPESEPTSRSRLADLEQRLSNQTTQLERMNQELDSFARCISHDLKAPLNSIHGFSRALTDRYGQNLDDAGRDFLTRIRGSTEEVNRLIEGLLGLSRLASAPLNPGTVDLTALARQAVAALRKRDPQRMVETAIVQGLRAWGDERQLRSVIEALISNAWKFCAQQPQARIEVGRIAGPEEAFFVRDNGVGFSMHQSSRLFGVFQRLHPTTQYPGIGTGLATVQRIIHRHGGRVWAEGHEGKGATFFFTLPLNRPDC